MSPPLEIGVIGAGSVGLAVVSFLHQAGAAVRLVARPAQVARLRRDGIERTGIFGRHRVPGDGIGVYEHPAAAFWGRRMDALLVCTKTFSSGEVAEETAAAWESLVEPAPVVLFHNGWGTAEIFAEHIPARRIFNARVITGFRRTEETASAVTVHGDAVALGSLNGADPRELAPLAAALEAGGLPTRISDQIGRDLWAKMLYNCALNPLGALRGVPYGALAENADTRALIREIVWEVFAVMRADGWQTHWRRPGDYLSDFYDHILPPTASHESSMLQDLRAGRRTEIDFLSGAVARIAVRHGFETPVNAALRDLVHAIEAQPGDGEVD